MINFLNCVNHNDYFF